MIDINQIIKETTNKPLIKVCGITQLPQVEALIEIGINFCGFIFYPKSKRFVQPHLSYAQIANIPTSIKKVGVFVNETIENVLNIAKQCTLDAIQLHGDEDADYCNTISKQFFTIKAIGVNSTTNINQATETYNNSIHAFLFDTKDEHYGGTGKKFNWQLLENATIEHPYFLSGGISPLDVGVLRQYTAKTNTSKLVALDINSKFENNYGVKDINSIKNFVIALNCPK